jgi:DNA adenine methylase
MTTALEASTSTVKPPLKWAGGKRWLVPYLEPLWRPFASARLVEPFCGGLSVALGLRPERALLNDINPHLMNFYRHVQGGLTNLLVMENDRAFYDRSRALFNQKIKDGGDQTTEAALLFYYLNRTGFNGLCRFNASGFFNVPFGKYKAINYRADFLDLQAVLAGWEFSCGDFTRIDLRPGDFVYADPPYDVEFTTYSAGGFDWLAQEVTARWLAQHDGPVVLSNQATPRIVDLYTACGFTIQYLDAPRRISCTGDRRPAQEVLATRNL